MPAARLIATAALTLLAGCADTPSPPASSETPETIAEWACGRLESGQPEEEVVPSLTSRTDRHDVDLRDTLTEVERRCPQHLAP